MKILKWGLIAFFILIILVRIYLTIFEEIPLGKLGVLVLLGLIFIIKFPNKFTWFTGVLLFGYGIYNIVFINYSAAEPTFMKFTAPLSFLIYKGDTSSWVRQLIDIIPDLFYLIALVLFFTKPIRKHYKISF